MNPERIKAYYELMKIGFGSELIKLFPGPLRRVERINNKCFLLETSKGRNALWLVRGDESRLLAELNLLRLLEEQGVEGFLFPVRLKNNEFYGALGDDRFFYITDWPELKPISFRNDLCLNSLSQIVINFRKAFEQADLTALNLKNSETDLINEFQTMINFLKSFVLLARYRLNPTGFDRLFLESSPRFIATAELALSLIQDTVYPDIYAAQKGFQPLINNFSRSNLRSFPNDQAVCLSLKESSLDLPLLDLALLISKTGRANRWREEWAKKMIDLYQESFLLTEEDLKIIGAYLTFPWEVYRLTSRYYHNRVNWSVGTFIEKMERLMAVEEDRKALARNLYVNA